MLVPRVRAAAEVGEVPGRARGGREPRSGDWRSGEPGAPGGARRDPGQAARGSHLGPREHRPPGDSGVRRRCARTAERRCFVCGLPGCGEASVSPPFSICNCVTCRGKRRCVQK
ncbi:hypothetical protein NN561_001591 [Cricetulus griseus]